MSNYKRGANFERRIAKKALKQGKLPMRSSGSHGLFDLLILDNVNWIIEGIQAKPASQRNKNGELNAEGKRIETELKKWEGTYRLITEVRTTRKIKKKTASPKPNQ